MRKSEKAISFIITLILSVVFFSAASFISLHYNEWFVREEPLPDVAVSFSDTLENRIILNMNQAGIRDGISDETLAEMNLYDFPTGESPYFIYVEKGAHTLSVFEKDEYGLYTKRVYTWSTAIGKTGSLTPVGTFAVGAKEEWHVWPARTVSPYATKFYEKENRYGGLFIHGPIYGYRTFGSLFEKTAKQIGTNCSSGCLRTETEAAYFVYELCPEGTLVKIVEGSPLGFTPDRKVYLYNQKRMPSLDKFLFRTKQIEKIEFAEESHTMELGEQYVPRIIISPEEAEGSNLLWTTNNPAIIKISGGCIWAVGTGSAIVSVASSDGSLISSMPIHITVHHVDTSQEPPDAGGKTTENNGNITEGYIPIAEELIYLRVNGEKIVINQSVKPLLKSLGAGFLQMPPAQSCAYDGYDRFFQYNYPAGYCYISTVPSLPDGGDAVCEIEFSGSVGAELEASRGIKPGDTLDDVKRAYGSYYTEIRVDDEKNPDNSFIRVTYWAGKPNDPSVPNLYFTLSPDTLTVRGMGIYSAKNMG
jgi:Uncharacterized protein conserved in bacteria